MWFKKKENDYIIYEANDYYDETFDIDTDSDSVDEKRIVRLRTVLLVLVGYIIFLFIGFLSTSFITNPVTGKKEPQIITVQLLEERKSYTLLKEYYLILKNLLQKTQEIDEQLQTAQEDQMFIYATKYESLLPTIDKHIPKVKGLVIDSKYEILLDQLINLYVNDLPIYLQKMGAALSKRDNNTLSEALSWREQIIVDFEQLRSNMKSFASIIKLEDKDLEDPVPLKPFSDK